MANASFEEEIGDSEHTFDGKIIPLFRTDVDHTVNTSFTLFPLCLLHIIFVFVSRLHLNKHLDECLFQ